jgi:hypothetical protein
VRERRVGAEMVAYATNFTFYRRSCQQVAIISPINHECCSKISVLLSIYRRYVTIVLCAFDATLLSMNNKKHDRLLIIVVSLLLKTFIVIYLSINRYITVVNQYHYY